ncbi:hypothetical protein ACFR9U_12765 [Halorientalis brevis]|uniref:Glycerophosphoryl diester phosphodiesterase membrane domain-containing protein n=1 Tax=Halorientalis brevis TaxID=1126241 RepID=A0ABD6CCH3_9EURY|nr:hypothetical protein [Halorientalis brevis]
MSLYAVENVGDAIEATKSFLLPFDRSRWLRLALIVLFVGGGLGLQSPANFGTSSSDFADTEAGPSDEGFEPTEVPSDLPDPIPTDDVWLLIGVVIGVVILLGLVLGFIGSVMEFVFVESLSRDAVQIRRYFGRHWRAGLRLFGFRLGVSLLGFAAVGLVGAAIAVVFFGGVPTDPIPAQILGAILVLVPVMIVVFTLVALVNGFTTAFVVPVMLAEDRTVLGGWRRFWPTLRGQLKQFGVYVVVAFVLTIAISLIAATAMGIGAVSLLIPFALVGGIAFVAGGAHLSLAVGAVLVVLALLYVALLVALLALVQVPLQTFLRLYTLLILGDTNEEFDVIADLRADVRQ